MGFTRPIPDNIVRDNFEIGNLRGTGRNDHLVHHRDASFEDDIASEISSFGGDDILEGSVPNSGQIHMFASKGNDWLILDVTKNPDADGAQGHHVYGGHGQDTFQFTNIANNHSPIIGRIDDFDPSSDRILIEDTEIDLTDLPRSIVLPGGEEIEVRVVSIEHPEFIDEGLGNQYFLAIGEDIFYALDGARDLENGTSGQTGEERHFLDPDALDVLRSAESVQYENPNNFVPREFYEHREDELNLNWNPSGEEVFGDPGDKDAVHMFGAKSSHHGGHHEPVMKVKDGDNVIDGNSGNDTLFGGKGDDLIAGGIDNDDIQGKSGDDMIWGGDGDDSVHGGKGSDYIDGGSGDDALYGGDGNDTIFGGAGSDTLTGGGGDNASNRFHFYEFYEEGGHTVITDFKVSNDLITIQDDIDPVTIELYEDDDGNTIINYGDSGSVELRGVSLSDFQDAAEARADEENPIISITPDPEEEMLQELRLETGYYGDEEPPSLYVDGIEYGSKGFLEDGPGGYAYVQEPDLDDGHSGHGGQAPTSPSPMPHDEVHHDHGDPNDDDVDDDFPMPSIPVVEDDDENPFDEEPTDEEASYDGTCFVATAAYQDPWHPDVVFLRAFRDQWLVNRGWGRAFVSFYWLVGPKLARPVGRHPALAAQSKSFISGIVYVLRRLWVSE